MPDGHERFNKYDRLPHICSRCDCLYQMNKKNCKQEFENCVSLPNWSPNPRNMGGCDIGHRFQSRRSLKMIERHCINRVGSAARRHKKCSPRRKPWVARMRSSEAPEGRKNRVPHVRKHLAPHDLLHARPAPVDQSGFPS
jgi:hypothetical protein